jgi:hypothetical protein
MSFGNGFIEALLIYNGSIYPSQKRADTVAEFKIVNKN